MIDLTTEIQRTMNKPTIDIKGLHVRHGKLEAVSGLDLRALPGRSWLARTKRRGQDNDASGVGRHDSFSGWVGNGAGLSPWENAISRFYEIRICQRGAIGAETLDGDEIVELPASTVSHVG